MQIGDAVKALREAKKIKQGELAKLCGITQTYLSQIENNKKRPNFNMLEKIGKCIGVPIPVLMFLSLSEDDVDDSKKALFKVMKPSIEKFIDEIFVTT